MCAHAHARAAVRCRSCGAAPAPAPQPHNSRRLGLPACLPCAALQVMYILDEIVMGGMVLETNIGEVLEAINEMAKLEATTKAASIKA